MQPEPWLGWGRKGLGGFTTIGEVLQEKGYRSIVYLRSPEASDVNDRRLIEKYGLKFYSFEVSPEALSRDLAGAAGARAGGQASHLWGAAGPPPTDVRNPPRPFRR